jgi:GTP-binding protein EngB required for normal cell division
MRELIRHILKEQPQLDEIDKKLYNFLLRRIRINERNIGGYTDDDNPIKVKEYSFEDLPGYGFTSYNSKKDIETKILNMMWENDIIKTHPYYDLNKRDQERVRIIKTIRHFLNHTL